MSGYRHEYREVESQATGAKRRSAIESVKRQKKSKQSAIGIWFSDDEKLRRKSEGRPFRVGTDGMLV